MVQVQTPVGDYNPDWAVVVRDQDSDDKLYLVRKPNQQRIRTNVVKRESQSEMRYEAF